MCVSTPKVPTVPERQAAKSPDSADQAGRSDDRARRRMAMAAAMMRGAGGLGGAPRVTTAGSTGPKMNLGA